MKSYKIVTALVMFALASVPFQRILAQAGSTDADFLYARKLYDDKLYSLAAQEFGKFIRNYATDARIPDARYYSGLANFNDGKFENARKDFQYLAIDFPKDKRAPEAWEKIAECYAAMGDYGNAANSLSSIATFYPTANNAVSTILLASDYYLKAGDPKSAREKLQKLIADRPDISEVHATRLKLALLYVGDKNFIQASQEFQNVIDKAKDPELVSQAIFEKARINDMSGRSDEARAAYVVIVSRYSKTRMNPYALFELGSILFREKQFADAKRNFEIVASNPSIAANLRNAAKINLGDLHYVNGRYSQAAELYAAIADMTSDSLNAIEANFKAGLTAERLKLPLSATDRYFTVVSTYASKAPGSQYVQLAFLKLAENYTTQRKFREAVGYYDQFVVRYPQYERLDRIYFERARILKDELKEYGESAYMLERLIKEFPKSALSDQAALGLVQSYRMNNQVDQALEILSSFKGNFPGSAFLEKAEDESRIINSYYQYGTNTTTQSIILLIGSLIDEKPKDEVTFVYAKLFFDQLKDYVGARQLFGKVISGTKNKDLAEDARYYLAQCYERLGAKTSEPDMYADSAMSVFKQLTVGRYADIASLKIIRNSLEKIDSDRDRYKKAKETYLALLDRFPDSPLRGDMILGLGDALLGLGEIKPPEPPKPVEPAKQAKGKPQDKKAAPPDTVKFFVSALGCYNEILRSNLTSSITEQAFYRRIEAYAVLQQPTDYLKVLTEYMVAYPRGRYIARVKYTFARWQEEHNDFSTAIANDNDLITHYYYTTYADSAAQGIGNVYLLSQQYGKAVEAYQNSLLKMQSEFSAVDIIAAQQQLHHPVEFKLAYCYEKMNNFTKSVEHYGNYLYPDNGGQYAYPSLIALATLYERKQDFQNALPFYQVISRQFRGTENGFQALNRVAEMFFAAQQYDSALVSYKGLSLQAKEKMQQLVFDSRVIVCSYRLGFILETTNLEKDFKKKYEDDKNLKILVQNYYAEFLYELGRYYQYNNKKVDYAQAFKIYTRVVEEYKSAGIVPDVLFEMAVIRFNEGKSKEGFDFLQSIPQKFPDNDILPRVYLRTAFEAFRLEQVSLAIEASKQALLNPRIKIADAKSGSAFLVKVYKAAGYYENALLLMQQYLEKFRDDDPANLFAMRIDIGVMHKNLRSYDRALEYFRDLIKTAAGEDEAEIQFNIADTYWAMGNFEQALLEYLRIPYLTLGKKFDWSSAAKSQAAECYVKLGKYEEAIRMYNDIIKTNGNQSEYSTYAKQRIDQIKALSKN